jgi:DNA-binding transcriptional regulator YiaG
MTTVSKGQAKAEKTRSRKKAAKQAPARRRTVEVTPVVREVPTLRNEFGISRKALARMTGLSERTLATWEGGGKINAAGQRAITAVERLLRELAEVIRKEAIADWLETPSEGFSGLKPVEVMERGEADRIWRMVYFLGSGTAS